MDYKLLLKRTEFLDYATIGELWIWNLNNNAFPKRFYTIEPPIIKDNRGFAAIPYGEYNIEYSYMLEHNVSHYELKKVPEHNEIFIHKGNSVNDTKGCILVGEKLLQKEFNGQFFLDNSTFAVGCIEMYLNYLPSTIMIYK